MLRRVRERVGRWIGGEPPAVPASPMLFADHDEIKDIARQMSRTKVELERSILALRGWARDLGRRLEEVDGDLGRASDLRALGETVGGLAHNFNNSLAAILAYTDLMLREAQGEAAVRRLTVIRDVALEASATVRRLQELISREPQVAVGPVALAAVIAEALEMTAPRWRDEAQRRGVAIEIVEELEAVPPVEGNAFELRDALVHLVLNAVAAMPSGGLLAIRSRSEESGWVVLEVQDTGVGMGADALRRVADGAAAAHPGRRAGRGLAAVQDVMERHGGAMTIESEPGKGTTVRLKLHASRFQIIPASEGAVEPVLPEQAARVLLVDDDQRLLTVLSDMLRAGGHEVETAGSGDEALGQFDPARHDVVITDLGMPRMTGWELAERVKGHSPATSVFLLTGWGEGVSANEASRFVDRIIPKPVSADALLAQLAGLRRHGRRGR